MATKKKSSSKKPSKPKMCLRKVDAHTSIMSDDPALPEVKETKAEKLKKGYTRVDNHTIIKTG